MGEQDHSLRDHKVRVGARIDCILVKTAVIGLIVDTSHLVSIYLVFFNKYIIQISH